MVESTKSVDVIIIGAGLSGLAAAYHIQRRSPGLSYLVLEANSRVGGRTLSIKVKGPNDVDDALDLGAHWVSTRQTHVMELIEKFGIGYYPQNTTGTKIMQVGDHTIRTYQSEIPSFGSWLALIDMQLLINEVEKLSKEVDINNPYAHKLAQELDSMTIETFIRERTAYGALWDTFNAAMNATLGCDSTQASALFFLAYANAAGGVMNLLLASNAGAQEYRVKGGTQQISENLLKEIGEENVLFDHPVLTINQESNKAEIVCANGSSFTCHRVIMTAPPNMIARIRFQPSLPKNQQSLYESMIMGNLCKVFVMYNKSFWLEKGFSGEVVTAGGPSFRMECERGPIAIVYDATTYKGTPLLVCFIAGKNADQWLEKSTADLKAAILDQLESYFGNQARNPIQFFVKDWRDEPYIGGGPANIAGPGRLQNFFLLRKVHKKVHFAGTAMASQWCGYMTGAIESGYRAASEVLTAMDPTSLTSDDRELLAAVHVKKGFPFEKSEWKPASRRRLINGTFIVGLAAGFLIATNRNAIANHIERIASYLPFRVFK